VEVTHLVWSTSGERLASADNSAKVGRGEAGACQWTSQLGRAAVIRSPTATQAAAAAAAAAAAVYGCGWTVSAQRAVAAGSSVVLHPQQLACSLHNIGTALAPCIRAQWWVLQGHLPPTARTLQQTPPWLLLLDAGGCLGC
jgi:hypothetical protein